MGKAIPVSALLEALSESLSAADIVATTNKVKIAGCITDWRIKNGMTQAEFAEYCDVSQSTISKWENGDFNFTIDKLAEICCKLDLELDISIHEPHPTSVIERFSKEYREIGSGVAAKIINLDSYRKQEDWNSSVCENISYQYEELKEE